MKDCERKDVGGGKGAARSLQSRTDVHQTAVPCVRNTFQFCSIAKITLNQLNFRFVFLKFKSLDLKHLWFAIKCIPEMERSIYGVKPVTGGEYTKTLALGLLFC